jgi:homoserine dehydrogenase
MAMVLCAAEADASAIVSALAPATASVLRPARVLTRPRPIRVGLLGLGHVGQAVVRLAHGMDAASHSRFRIAGALVRDVALPRACHPCVRVTNSAAAFLRGRYDVVIESLGGLEPARSIVERLLGMGIPVVTANKTLMAVAGADLQAVAAARGTSLRYEASAIAGVPFLGALAARPLVSAVDRFAAILNGTSNFILSTLETEGGSFAEALALAERRGLTEPDPSRDLDGGDAADKLDVLTALLGWGRADRRALEVTGVRRVTGEDLRAARTCGGSLKPVAIARRGSGGIEAFVGPAWVPAASPLATLRGTLNGIALHGRYISDLCFSGPGAGPDVTAATLLDDAIETFHGTSVPRRSAAEGCAPDRALGPVTAPVTPWFIRVEFPGHVPTAAVTADLLSRGGLAVEHVSAAAGQACYALVARADRAQVDGALQTLRQRHRLGSVAYRRVE